MQEIKVIQAPASDKPFAVIYKPYGLPSAPLAETDENNALFLAIKQFPEIKSVAGKKPIEYGLLHRIDTPTEGLLLIATTQEFYDYMMKQQAEGKFIKTYTAECNLEEDNSITLEGFPPFNKPTYQAGQRFTVSSFFRSYGEGLKSVRPVTEQSGKAALKKLGKAKLYSTEVLIKKVEDKKVNVECKIQQGFRHQVRCHLAWVGLPIAGDELYNSTFKNDTELKFKASGFTFDNMTTGKKEEYNC